MHGVVALDGKDFEIDDEYLSVECYLNIYLRIDHECDQNECLKDIRTNLSTIIAYVWRIIRINISCGDSKAMHEISV